MNYEIWNNKNYYNNYWKNYNDGGKNDISLLLKKIKEINPSSVLEVGCGSGRFLRSIKKHYPNISIYGVDISEEAIKYNMEHNDGVFWVCDARDFRQKVDLVFSWNDLIIMPYIINDVIKNISCNTKGVLFFEPFFYLQNIVGKWHIIRSQYTRGIPFYVMDNGFSIKEIGLTGLGSFKHRIGMLHGVK